MNEEDHFGEIKHPFPFCFKFISLASLAKFFNQYCRFWILIPALLSDAIALIKGMGKGDFRVGHARDVPTLVR